MKKLLSTLFLSALLIAGSGQVIAAESENLPQKPKFEQMQKNKQDFEKRLNLTDKQKEKAKKIHQKGASQMKPIMKKIGDLRKEIAEIKKSDINESVKQEKIDKKFQEIKKLDKKARDIRKQNSKEFEKILTDEQKSELNKMKAEGRKNFERKHHPRPPFNMFGPDFKNGERGIHLPPPPMPPKADK